MKGVNVASITNTKRCNAVMIRVLPYPSDLLRGHIQDVTPHAAAGQSRTLLGSPCASHCHHEKGHPKISTELAGELFCTEVGPKTQLGLGLIRSGILSSKMLVETRFLGLFKCVKKGFFFFFRPQKTSMAT